MRLLFELFGYTSLQLIHQSAFVYISIVIYVHCTAVTLEILFSYHFWCCVGVLAIFCSVQLNLAYSSVQLKSKANILWQLSCARMNCVQNNNKKNSQRVEHSQLQMMFIYFKWLTWSLCSVHLSYSFRITDNIWETIYRMCQLCNIMWLCGDDLFSWLSPRRDDAAADGEMHCKGVFCTCSSLVPVAEFVNINCWIW